MTTENVEALLRAREILRDIYIPHECDGDNCCILGDTVPSYALTAACAISKLLVELGEI